MDSNRSSSPAESESSANRSADRPSASDGRSQAEPDSLPELELSDRELIAAMRSGQLSALRALYRRYVQLVYSFAYRVLGSQEEAEDIVQEVFLALWEKDRYRSERGGLASYLITMAKSRATDRLRSKTAHHQRLRRWQLASNAIPDSNPEEMASLQERRRRVRAALTHLSINERQILEIGYFDGLSQSEIARQLDIPLGTVKSRSRRALQKLRQALRDLN